MMIIAGAAALEVIAQEREQNPPVQTEHVDLAKSVHIFPNPAVAP
jgi:hypothetical protein